VVATTRTRVYRLTPSCWVNIAPPRTKIRPGVSAPRAPCNNTKRTEPGRNPCKSAERRNGDRARMMIQPDHGRVRSAER
jgi:hypothetical protein